MAEYIDREAFKKSVEERYCLPCKAEGKDYNGCRCRACWVDDMLDEVDCFQPTADVAPVRHGRWIDAYPDIEPNPMFMYGICSECGFEQAISKYLKYCPDCGAKMDEKEGKHEDYT